IGPIRDKSIGRCSNCAFDQAEQDTCRIWMGGLDNTVAHLYPMPRKSIRKRDWQFLHCFDDNVSISTHDNKCLRSNDVTQEIKCHIATIEDIRDTGLKHRANSPSLA